MANIKTLEELLLCIQQQPWDPSIPSKELASLDVGGLSQVERVQVHVINTTAHTVGEYAKEPRGMRPSEALREATRRLLLSSFRLALSAGFTADDIFRELPKMLADAQAQR